MFKTTLIAAITLSSFAFAAGNVSSTTSMKVTNPHPFTIALDGTSVLLSGIGVKGTYAVSEKVSVGGAIKTFELKADDEDKSYGYNYTHKVYSVGAIAEFFPFSSVNESGMYATAAVTSAKLESKVSSKYTGKGSATDSSTGGQIILGYQFVSKTALSDKADLMFQAGLGYGNGARVAWRYSGNKTDLQDSVLLDLTAGLQF